MNLPSPTSVVRVGQRSCSLFSRQDVEQLLGLVEGMAAPTDDSGLGATDLEQVGILRVPNRLVVNGEPRK